MNCEATRDVPPELDLDVEAEIGRLQVWIRSMIRDMRRRGAVVGVSGGVDSAVCTKLAARAVGADRIRALLMPERDSDPAGTSRARDLCDTLGIRYTVVEVTTALEALGCYAARDEAVRGLFPDFGEGHRMKITVSGDPARGDRVNTFDLTVEDPDGTARTRRMPATLYRAVVSATNMKQRTRKLVEYRYAEALNYAVLGTPNRLEYDLGFFVRGGDGLADLKPIAHLYKSQVYALAAALDIPEDIRMEPPTTDTYTLPQTQEEFYFALPFRDMDRFLRAWHEGLSRDEAGARLGLGADASSRIYADIEAKRRVATLGVRAAPVPPNPDTTGTGGVA